MQRKERAVSRNMSSPPSCSPEPSNGCNISFVQSKDAMLSPKRLSATDHRQILFSGSNFSLSDKSQKFARVHYNENCCKVAALIGDQTTRVHVIPSSTTLLQTTRAAQTRQTELLNEGCSDAKETTTTPKQLKLQRGNSIVANRHSLLGQVPARRRKLSKRKQKELALAQFVERYKDKLACLSKKLLGTGSSISNNECSRGDETAAQAAKKSSLVKSMTSVTSSMTTQSKLPTETVGKELRHYRSLFAQSILDRDPDVDSVTNSVSNSDDDNIDDVGIDVTTPPLSDPFDSYSCFLNDNTILSRRENTEIMQLYSDDNDSSSHLI